MIFMGLPLLPAWQRFNSLVVTPDRSSLYIGLGLVVGFVLLITIVGRKEGGSFQGKGRSGSKPISWRSFRRRASAMGLNKPLIRILENLAERHFRGNSEHLLSNQAVLDRLLSAGLEDIALDVSPADVKENQRATLYQIRQIILRNRHRRMVLRTTKDLRLGQQMILTTQSGSNHSARLLANTKRGLGSRCPRKRRN